MKPGAENRKKTILLGALAAGAFCGIVFNLYQAFGPNTPPPSVAPVAPTSAAFGKSNTRAGSSSTAAATTAGAAAQRAGSGTVGAVPGVAAQRIATTSSSLDPTLDESAMLRTESLVYAGSGRNIFSALYTPPPVIPSHVPPPRPIRQPQFVPPANPGPPPPPPIPLKFFGTAQRSRGVKQAFLLSGEDVYLASPGDIVAKRYKVTQILPFGVQVTDLTNNNTQTLPMQQ